MKFPSTRFMSLVVIMLLSISIWAADPPSNAVRFSDEVDYECIANGRFETTENLYECELFKKGADIYNFISRNVYSGKDVYVAYKTPKVQRRQLNAYYTAHTATTTREVVQKQSQDLNRVAVVEQNQVTPTHEWSYRRPN